MIVSDFAFLKLYCERKEITYPGDEQIIKDPLILQRFQEEVDGLNENFAQYERVKKFALMPRCWTINEGELTPTLKVKRKMINQKNKDLIEGLYKD